VDQALALVALVDLVEARALVALVEDQELASQPTSPLSEVEAQDLVDLVEARDLVALVALEEDQDSACQPASPPSEVEVSHFRLAFPASVEAALVQVARG